MKALRSILSLLLVLLLLVPTLPAAAATDSSENGNAKAVNNSIIIDDDATDGYEGDYVVIYNPATSSSTSYSTGTMTGLIDTTIDANVNTFPTRNVSDPDRPYKIDVSSTRCRSPKCSRSIPFRNRTGHPTTSVPQNRSHSST